MDFSQTQRDPTRKLIGIGAVVLFHILIVYALITGLARKVVEVVKGPIEVKVIEEVIKKPPPPPEVLPPPPKMAAPPPPFIPPPEINIAPPPTPAPTITAVTPEPPPAPQAPVIAAAATCARSTGDSKCNRGVSELSRSVAAGLSTRGADGWDSGRSANRIHRCRQRADSRFCNQELVASRFQ